MMAFQKLFFAVLAVSAVFLHRAEAQLTRVRPYNYWRIAVGAGSSNYLGDLDDDFTLKFSRPGAAFSAAYRVTPLLSVRGSLYYGRLSADDKKSTDPIRQRRNLNFNSHLVEASLVGVVDFRTTQRRAKFRPNFTPYAFAGVAFFQQPSLNIRTASGNTAIVFGGDLPEPGATRALPVSIPMGVGMRFKVTPNIDIEVETGFRRTFSDYLDGVSNEYNIEIAGSLTDARANSIDLPVNPDLAFDPATFILNDRNAFHAAMMQKHGMVFPRYEFDQSLNNGFGGWYIPDADNYVNMNGVRGHSEQKDWYTFTAITVSYYLPNSRRCPTFR